MASISSSGGWNGENAESIWATPSTISPLESVPKKPSCLRTSRFQSWAPRGWSGLMHTTVQFNATLSAHFGSSRSARPRVCVTAVGVVALVRSMSPVTAGASHPSPRRARVPMSTCAAPEVKNEVTYGTQSRLVQRPSMRLTPATGSVTLSRAASSTSSTAMKSTSACRTSGGPATVRPETSSGFSRAVWASATKVSKVRRADPDRSSRTSRTSAAKVAVADSKSQRTSIRKWSPRVAASAETMSTQARGFAAEWERTRSVGDRPATIPLRVQRYPIAGSRRRIASARSWSDESSETSR